MWQQFLPLIIVTTLFLVIVIADRLIEFFLLNSFIGPKYRLFIAPGVIIHELSHAIAIKLTGQEIHKINVTDPNGGFVLYNKPKNHLTQIFISLAPIFGITAVFLLITYFLQPDWLNFNNFKHQPLNNFFDISFARWQTWLHLYLTVSLAASLSPSKQDFKIAIPGLFILFLLLFILCLTPLQDKILIWLEYTLIPFFSIILPLIIALSISFIVYLISLIASRR